MSRIDYWGIEQAIATIIKAAVPRASVIVEEELDFAEGDVVGIYLDQRSAPAELQSLSAGTRLREQLAFKIWCWHFGFGKDRSMAMQSRDALIGDVETALMANNNLNSTANFSYILGGEFINGPEPTDRGFAAGGTVDLLVDAIGSI